MTRQELRALKKFLSKWFNFSAFFILIAFCVLIVVAMYANNRVPQACPKLDLASDGECLSLDSEIGYFDWHLMFRWTMISAVIVLIPSIAFVINRTILAGREKTGLTPEARRARMRRLEDERNQAVWEAENRDKLIARLEHELEVGRSSGD